MLKLGEYDESEARSIAESLRKAGIKVEIKPSIDASIETGEFLQGKFSDLKADIVDEETIEKYERYLAALRKVLESKPSPDEFMRLYIDELFPGIDELKAKLEEMAEKGEQEESEAVEQEDDEQLNLTIDPEDKSNLADKLLDIVSRTAKTFGEGEEARNFAISVFSLNEIEPGEEVGSLLDDPVAAIPVDLDDYDIDHPGAKETISVFLDKNYEIYVDEFSTTCADDLDDEFIEEYEEEHIKIMSIGILLTDLIENHSSEKMDLQTFEDECVFAADLTDRSLRIVGYSVADEIAKILEKNGAIKIKGDTIRWKK